MSLPNLDGKLVLVVEDDEMSFLYLKQLLILTSCRLFRARSGSEALDLFRDHSFDLILMDIQLPDMDGTQITRKMRQSNPGVPIIAQTAGRTSDTLAEAMEAGCSSVLVKPFSMEELFEVISKYVR